MNEKEIQQLNLRGHLQVIVSFFIFMVLSIAVFFFCVQTRVEQEVEATIHKNVLHQTFHFQSIMDIQFEYLESIAGYLGMQDELLSEGNMELIGRLREKSGLERVAIINEEGMSHYDNGVIKDVANRAYFQEAMKGSRTLSDPLKSKVDSYTRVILGVPIYKEDKICGVLGGSYNVGALSHMMFEDIYDGEGICIIVTDQGRIVSFDGNRDYWNLESDEEFFEMFQDFEVTGDNTMEQIQDDIAGHREGKGKISGKNSNYYLAYEPLDVNGWMICYVVSGDKAMEEYRFVNHYEYILSCVLGVGIFLSIWLLFYQSNRRQKLLFEYAQTDALTGLYNKERTEQEIEEWFSKEERQYFQAFFMIDIDCFKAINDVFGHAAGDEALRQVGKILKEEFWSSDIVGRIGGDEFVVLMKNIRDKETAVSHGKNFGERIRNLKVKGMEAQKITCSIGIAYAPEHGSGYHALYKCADSALYKMKRGGRDGYCIYESDLQQQ